MVSHMIFSFLSEVNRSVAHCATVNFVKPNPVKEYLAKLGRRGGKATAAKLTPEQRKASARKAAQARWATKKKDVDND